MNDNETIDQAAQEQEDHESMVESTVDRQIFAGMEKIQRLAKKIVEGECFPRDDIDEARKKLTEDQ